MLEDLVTWYEVNLMYTGPSPLLSNCAEKYA